MTPDFPAIDALVPHGTPMLLLERVLAMAGDRLVAETTVRADMPLVRDGALPAYATLEIMAQAVSAYAGYQRHAEGLALKLGFLLGTRQLTLATDRIACGQRLTVEVNRLYDDGEMASFRCRTLAHAAPIAECTLSVFQPHEVESFLLHGLSRGDDR